MFELRKDLAATQTNNSASFTCLWMRIQQYSVNNLDTIIKPIYVQLEATSKKWRTEVRGGKCPSPIGEKS